MYTMIYMCSSILQIGDHVISQLIGKVYNVGYGTYLYVIKVCVTVDGNLYDTCTGDVLGLHSQLK